MYADLIRQHVPADFDPRHVEAYMRGEFGTLDHLSPAAFARSARESAEAVALDRDMAEELAQSYGL